MALHQESKGSSLYQFIKHLLSGKQTESLQLCKGTDRIFMNGLLMIQSNMKGAQRDCKVIILFFLSEELVVCGEALSFCPNILTELLWG